MEEWTLSEKLKHQIKESIQNVEVELTKIKQALDNEHECILCKVEEIQHMLMHIQANAASYYMKTYLSPFTDCYISLTTAMQHLAEKKHGALIAIERQDALDNFIQSGTPLTAQLTAPLLESIFYPGNPLHDGAVLIKENHIISAANILPLSQRVAKERKLGTRHRAAIGLSEVSDAFVLVVSEETGRTSFALDGTLYTISL
ncbi:MULTISPECIES: sporulation-specific diadenylate cyclase CdaS [unclassified Bacillus (in: firmicutes)]|uniref:sporulation-specific diadenylate cyclase CdaS n=1 Tax=unclassified Bacillus (in: firmicutes) TaxID=185979 RepID=UPI003D25CF2C